MIAEARARLDLVEDAPSSGFDRFLDQVCDAAPLPITSESLVSGTVVDDKFEIAGVLGRGGMGVVYLARDLALDRPVALKMIRLERRKRAALVDAFEREARATAKLRHPNVVTVHQSGVWHDQFYLVLERLSGVTLAQRLARGPLPLGELLDVTEQLLAGLAHAHRMGLVHRDLKPANVFLEVGGTVKLLDFGLAVLTVPETDVRSIVAGTPGYMAPEQRRGEPTDERADIWSMGVMLHEMALGVRPREDDVELRSPRPVRGSLSLLAPVWRHALVRDAASRPSSATELLGRLRRVRRTLAWRRRGRWLAPIALAISAWCALVGLSRMRARAALDSARLDLSGQWYYEPGGTHPVEITRLSPVRYRLRYSDGSLAAAPRPDRFFFIGELVLERSDDRLRLHGQVHDLPGSRYAGVGEMDFEVQNPHRMWMTRSRWGAQPSQTETAYEPWALVRRP
jgi:serine/threonine protein kinase